MSKSMEIKIDNLKCGGCEASILKGLNSIVGVSEVSVNHEAQTVKVNAPASMRKTISDKLWDMGYPEQGSVRGLTAGLANAKSYVSCAIGRMA